MTDFFTTNNYRDIDCTLALDFLNGRKQAFSLGRALGIVVLHLPVSAVSYTEQHVVTLDIHLARS